MKLLLCEIPWMKKYNRYDENDIPFAGDKALDEEDYSNEYFTFQDNNGSCYGLCDIDEIKIDVYYKGVRKNSEYVQNAVVIWISSDKKGVKRVVGWYENATIYRKKQIRSIFTDLTGSNDIKYNIISKSMDSKLIPEDKRTFSFDEYENQSNFKNIQLIDTSVEMPSYADDLIDFINNYDFGTENLVLTDELLYKEINESEKSKAPKELYEKGASYFEKEEYINAFRYFNEANKKSENLATFFAMGSSLYYLYAFDKAIEIYKKMVELEGEKIHSIEKLMCSYDHIGDIENTIYYCKKLIELLDNEDEFVSEKIDGYAILFDIYIHLERKNEARNIIKKIEEYSNKNIDKVEEYLKNMREILS